MKKKVLIIAFLIAAQIGAFSIKSHAQDKEPVQKELIADETTLIFTKTGAKIECDNGEIADKIVYAFKEDVKRFGWSWKKDRHGAYKHYQIFVSKETAELIKSWAKKNL